MGECNPACQKIIINSGLMAPLAERLAERVVDTNVSLANELRDLAKDAHLLVTIHGQLMNGGLIQTQGEANWNGCEQAATLVAWSREEGSIGTARTAVALLQQWRAEIWTQIAALVSAKA
jgi:hypothetical protein